MAESDLTHKQQIVHIPSGKNQAPRVQMVSRKSTCHNEPAANLTDMYRMVKTHDFLRDIAQSYSTLTEGNEQENKAHTNPKSYSTSPGIPHPVQILDPPIRAPAEKRYVLPICPKSCFFHLALTMERLKCASYKLGKLGKKSSARSVLQCLVTSTHLQKIPVPSAQGKRRKRRKGWKMKIIGAADNRLSCRSPHSTHFYGKAHRRPAHSHQTTGSLLLTDILAKLYKKAERMVNDPGQRREYKTYIERLA